MRSRLQDTNKDCTASGSVKLLADKSRDSKGQDGGATKERLPEKKLPPKWRWVRLGIAMRSARLRRPVMSAFVRFKAVTRLSPEQSTPRHEQGLEEEDVQSVKTLFGSESTEDFLKDSNSAASSPMIVAGKPKQSSKIKNPKDRIIALPMVVLYLL